jgi:uncharacterized protein
MLIHDLSPSECADILRRSSIGRLACSHFDQPYIVPISFSFDAQRECVYGFSTIGQKILWMRENPKVCLEVDDIADKDHWTTVVILGRYAEIQQTPDEAEARKRAQQFFQARQQWWLPGAAKTSSRDHDAVVLYRITLDHVTGRRTAREQ